MPLEVGEDVLVADVQTLRELALERLSQRCDMRVSGIPYVIFGHSMGSFITRVFLTCHAFGVRAPFCAAPAISPVAFLRRARPLRVHWPKSTASAM